jgi:hypothetical protein
MKESGVKKKEMLWHVEGVWKKVVLGLGKAELVYRQRGRRGRYYRCGQVIVIEEQFFGALYHLSHASSPFCSGFLEVGSCLEHNPPFSPLARAGTGMTGMHHHVLPFFLLRQGLMNSSVQTGLELWFAPSQPPTQLR